MFYVYVKVELTLTGPSVNCLFHVFNTLSPTLPDIQLTHKIESVENQILGIYSKAT